ncbi:MAG: hypothetical protein QM539_10705 [Alphaproteobacteria bacterium]|nr:hypothetical protein [Alphaproteobacteria bacterium]
MSVSLLLEDVLNSVSESYLPEDLYQHCHQQEKLESPPETSCTELMIYIPPPAPPSTQNQLLVYIPPPAPPSTQNQLSVYIPPAPPSPIPSTMEINFEEPSIQQV